MAIKTYSSLLEAIKGLRAEGYTADFTQSQRCMWLHKIFKDDFVIDKHYHFKEKEENHKRNTLYAISSQKYQFKGLLVNTYGAYCKPISSLKFSIQ